MGPLSSEDRRAPVDKRKPDRESKSLIAVCSGQARRIMFGIILAVLRSLGAAIQSHGQLLLENLPLRHQLLVLNRTARKPKFRDTAWPLWIGLRAVWSHWEKALVIIQPQTVIGWRRAGFRLYWRWKSRRRDGRPPIKHEFIRLIRSEERRVGKECRSRRS